MRKVGVLFGGISSEREISILTGVFVCNLIDKEKYQPIPLYIDEDGVWRTSPQMVDIDFFKRGERGREVFLLKGKIYAKKRGRIKELSSIDCAINCCHGGWGEGGGMSAFIEEQGVKFASPDTLSSAVFLDKYTTKLFCKSLRIPCVEYCKVCEGDYAKRGAFFIKTATRKLGFPMVIKPCRGGSSIGVVKVDNEEELKRALLEVFTLDEKVIVEKFIDDKRDINCAAYLFDGEIFISQPEEAFGGEIYSFHEKYINEKRKKSKGVEGAIAEKIRAYTRTIYKRMGMKGVVRMDYIVSGEKVYLGEVNTVPGSLAYYLFCERLSGAKEFFGDLIEEGLREVEKKKIVQTGALQKVRGGKHARGVRV